MKYSLLTYGYKQHRLHHTARLPIAADTEQSFASCLDFAVVSPASLNPPIANLWTIAYSSTWIVNFFC